MSAQTEASNLQRLRVQMLYRQTVWIQVAGFLNMVFYAYIVKDEADHFWLISWLFVSGLIYLMRSLFQSWFIKGLAQTTFDPKKWENAFALGVLTTALCWSCVDLWIVPIENPAQCAFLAFMLAGVTAASSTAYSTSPKASLAFLLPLILPFAYRLIESGTSYNYSMGSLLILYAVVISSAMYKIHRVIIESIQLRFEKDQLLKTLSDTRANVVNSAKMAALGEMAGGVAHEINTPLGALQLYVDTIENLARKEDVDGKKLLEITKNLEAMIFRISKIVKNLIAFAGQDEEDKPVTVPIDKILIDTLDFCQSRFQNNGIALEIKSEKESLFICCKPSQISQILLNIINNAFDAVKEKPQPKVSIEIENDDNNVFFKISDNGDGISSEIAEKVMQPFFTTKDVGKGAGLGLSVALGIARAHEGDLILSPSPKGACFVLRLPKAVARAVG